MLPGVSKTSILTMRARADEHVREDRLFSDPLAAAWWAQVDWPTELDSWYAPDAQNTLAMRADDIDVLTRQYADALSSAPTVVELGCGLSTRRDRLASMTVARWFDLDLPPVAELRTKWNVDAEQIGMSVLDFAWMDRITGDPSNTIFIAEGLLYYLPRDSVTELIDTLRERFAGSVIVMDVLGTNDFPKLLENTTAVGTPISWKLEDSYDQVLTAFGLQEVPSFEPARITDEMLRRYWHRFSAKIQTAIFFGMNVPEIWSRRSGDILGRL